MTYRARFALAWLLLGAGCFESTQSADKNTSFVMCEQDADCSAGVCVDGVCTEPAAPRAANAGPGVDIGQATTDAPTSADSAAAIADRSGAQGTAGSAGVTEDGGPTAPLPTLPAPAGSCPQLVSGSITLDDQQVRLWVGQPGAEPGAILLYWHATGSTADEAATVLGSVLDEIVAAGGLVAAFTSTTGDGNSTGNGTWFTGDFALADRLVGCALAQLDVDPLRIYTGGCSTGGLQAGAMAIARAGYLAAALTVSGGIVGSHEFDDPVRTPSLMAVHASGSMDSVVLDFTQASRDLGRRLGERGGHVVDCAVPISTCGLDDELRAAQSRFLRDHPFGVTPAPYADGLPELFPEGCEVVRFDG